MLFEAAAVSTGFPFVGSRACVMIVACCSSPSRLAADFALVYLVRACEESCRVVFMMWSARESWIHTCPHASPVLGHAWPSTLAIACVSACSARGSIRDGFQRPGAFILSAGFTTCFIVCRVQCQHLQRGTSSHARLWRNHPVFREMTAALLGDLRGPPARHVMQRKRGSDARPYAYTA